MLELLLLIVFPTRGKNRKCSFRVMGIVELDSSNQEIAEVPQIIHYN